MVSIASLRMSGPYKYIGIRINVESVCGLTWLRAYPDWRPDDTSSTLHMDAVSGAGAAICHNGRPYYRRARQGPVLDFSRPEPDAVHRRKLDGLHHERPCPDEPGQSTPFMAPPAAIPAGTIAWSSLPSPTTWNGQLLSGFGKSGVGLRSTLCRRGQSVSHQMCWMRRSQPGHSQHPRGRLWNSCNRRASLPAQLMREPDLF